MEIGRASTPLEQTMIEEPWEEPKEPPQNYSEESTLEDDVFSEDPSIIWRPHENQGIRRKLVETTHPLGTARMRQMSPGCERDAYGYQFREDIGVTEERPDSPPPKKSTLKEREAHEIQTYSNKPVAAHEQDNSDPLMKLA